MRVRDHSTAAGLHPPGAAARPRVILHVDMDAFFVSVELRRRPELLGKPVVVGGTGRRGVVAAASDEARQFGVHSALPSAVARRRCPHAVFLPGDHTLYGEVSEQVHEIFERYTPRVEPLALDEAFLDVSGATRLFGERAALDERTLSGVLGTGQAAHLHALAWGRDERPVETEREAKSIGHEETYPRDLVERAEVDRELVRLADAVAARLRRRGVAARTASLKVRFAGFRTITRAITLQQSVETGPALVDALRPILQAIDVSEGVRLLGVSGSNFVAPAQQLNLLADAEAPLRAAGAIDEIRERFGPAAIGPASAVGPRGVDVVRKGARQWGPDLPSDDQNPPTR